MGILQKVFGGGKKDADAAETPPCAHTSLVQRWENAEEMGRAELATYVCTACGEVFSYERTQAILAPAQPPRDDEAEPAGVYDDRAGGAA